MGDVIEPELGFNRDRLGRVRTRRPRRAPCSKTPSSTPRASFRKSLAIARTSASTTNHQVVVETLG